MSRRSAAVWASVSTVALAVLLRWSIRLFGARSIRSAFLLVWLPMVWLGTLSKFIRLRLPDRWYTLRAFERDGRLYEQLGVRVVKRLLRRGLFARFNPRLHLPAQPTSASVTDLDQRMRQAEASHGILLIATLGPVTAMAARRWWGTALWTLLFDGLVNGYPVMLQRYNRAFLQRRFGSS